MILVPCPHCGPRNASEFRYLGKEQPRPVPGSVTQAEWRAYLYVYENPAGWTTETWFHALGCRAFFVAERHTVTNEFRATARPEEPQDS
jgi:heterotetrameric sarcosine oxidase delta subunit